MQVKGSAHAKAVPLALPCHDAVCLTETWSTKHDAQLTVPGSTCLTACKSVCDTLGHHSGEVFLYMSDQLQRCVELVKSAEDGSFLCLKLKRVMQDCLEVIFCVCHMPRNKLYKDCELKTPYACLQDAFLQFKGSEVLICGDMKCPNCRKRRLCQALKGARVP